MLVAVLGHRLAAQSTRVEAIAEEQAEKAKELGVEGPSEAEQIVRRVLLSPLLSGGDGLYPWFGSVFSGTGMALGVGYLKRLENAAYVNVADRHFAEQLDDGARHGRGARVVARHAAGRRHGAVARRARRVVLRQRPGLRRSTTRERYDYKPMELAGNATIKPMRFLSVTGSYSFLNFNTTLDAAALHAAGDARASIAS